MLKRVSSDARGLKVRLGRPVGPALCGKSIP